MPLRKTAMVAVVAVMLVAGGAACAAGSSGGSAFGRGEARVQTASASFDLVTATGTFDPQTRELSATWRGDGRTFTVAGPARVGSYPTSARFVVALSGPGGLSSDDGSCTVQLARADRDGVAGNFDCRGAGVSGSFTLTA